MYRNYPNLWMHPFDLDRNTGVALCLCVMIRVTCDYGIQTIALRWSHASPTTIVYSGLSAYRRGMLMENNNKSNNSITADWFVGRWSSHQWGKEIQRWLISCCKVLYWSILTEIFKTLSYIQIWTFRRRRRI